MCYMRLPNVLIDSYKIHRNENMKRVQVSFTTEQWKLIETLKGEFGNESADIVRNIVLAWLAEKSYVSQATKKRIG